MKLNNKGFTLIEVLAVVVIIALVTGITIPTVINSMNASKENAYNIMVDNIKTASIQLYEEVYNSDGFIELYKYDISGNKTSEVITIDGDIIEVNLQSLVSNGYLTGSTNEENNKKIIINPKDNENIGNCIITISKSVDENSKVTYTITSDGALGCPTTSDYAG